MRVLHCSTSVSNSSANVRMQNALIKSGIESKILVLFKGNHIIQNVNDIGEFGFGYRIYQKFAYYFNILEFYFLKDLCGLQKGMPYSWIPIGIDVSKLVKAYEIDVIHLHCVNSCYLSLNVIRKLSSLNKPIVITLHDSWFLTGGCHVLDGCTNYQNNCVRCSEIKRGNFIRRKHFKRKRKILELSNVYFTAPSKWTYENYIKSGLKKDKCCIIGNTLNFDIFKPSRNVYASDCDRKIKLLFGALNGVETPYKGFGYLVEMLQLLYNNHIELADKIELHIFGAETSNEGILDKFHCKFWGYIASELEMARLYDMCNIYIVPSLEDSFNQTVLESCACATPVVSFQTGGICDIIRHKETGYLAQYKDAADLLNGVFWILRNNINNSIGIAARQDVKKRFAEAIIAKQWSELYTSLIRDKKIDKEK